MQHPYYPVHPINIPIFIYISGTAKNKVENNCFLEKVGCTDSRKVITSCEHVLSINLSIADNIKVEGEMV